MWSMGWFFRECRNRQGGCPPAGEREKEKRHGTNLTPGVKFGLPFDFSPATFMGAGRERSETMYLHLGQNEIVPTSRVIGIFDLDNCSTSRRTRDFLAAAEREGVVLDVSGDLPKSFVVCDHPYHEQIVYLSQLNPSTLRSRAESGVLEG